MRIDSGNVVTETVYLHDPDAADYWRFDCACHTPRALRNLVVVWNAALTQAELAQTVKQTHFQQLETAVGGRTVSNSGQQSIRRVKRTYTNVYIRSVTDGARSTCVRQQHKTRALGGVSI